MIGDYVDGYENGIFKFYYPDGKIKMEGQFSAGERHNMWKFYDEEGILKTTILYKFGEEEKIDGKNISEKEKKNKN